MPKFEWTEQHCVFVPEIDAEHQLLFQLCGKLQRAVRRTPAPAVCSLVNEIGVHCLEHFWHEERLMREAKYSFYCWHKQQHGTAAFRFSIFKDRIKDGDMEALPELLAFLQDWLNNHIRLTDRMLGAHLRNRSRQLAAEAELVV